MGDIRTGKVSSVDYEKGMLRVTYEDRGKAVTAEMPYANYNNEYRMPAIGESVLVAHLSNGSSRGVVLGTMWNRKNQPVEGRKGLYRKELSKRQGEAFCRYEDTTGEYTIQSATINMQTGNECNINAVHVSVDAIVEITAVAKKINVEAGKMTIGGGEGGMVEVENQSDIYIQSAAKQIETKVRKAVINAMEGMEISSEADINLRAESSLVLEDADWSTTLKNIMDRLEALDGVSSDKK